jgi:hypothetical protein
MDVAGQERLSPSPPERRYLTIMFIDMVGYTELSEQLEPEDLLALLNRYQQLALTVMERFGGFVASFSGDGVLVYFGYPTAHGNDAERALRAALEMIERLSAMDLPLSDGGTRRWGGKDRRAYGPGDRGARVHELRPECPRNRGRGAEPGGAPAGSGAAQRVVVSGDTISLVEDLFEFEPLGALMLKGLSRSVEAVQIIRARPAPEYERVRRLRSSTSMVGREAALSLMLACWKTVREQSRCQVLVVVGDAGLGKTRLVNEFFSHPAIGTVSMAHTHCYEIFANTALFPVASFLWKRTGLTLGDDENSRRQKLARMLDEYGLSNEENRKILAGFPGLTTGAAGTDGPTTQLSKLKQCRLIISILDRVARDMPMVLSFEDVHRLDPSSSEFLIELATTLRDSPLLILMTTRSFPRGPALPAANEVIHLEQLGTDDCLEIARSVPGA